MKAKIEEMRMVDADASYMQELGKAWPQRILIGAWR